MRAASASTRIASLAATCSATRSARASADAGCSRVDLPPASGRPASAGSQQELRRCAKLGRVNFLVGDAEAGARLDLALAALANCSRSQARRWIEQGRVRVNERDVQPSVRVRAGDLVEAIPPDPEPSGVAPETIPLAVLHEDEDLIVLDKPAGLVVHPAPGHAGGTLVNALLYHCDDLAGVGDVLRPGIVHRLDRGTSGVLVVAKSDLAHRHLAEQFREHSVERVYLALVRG